MNHTLKIAWRNLWRNKRRTLITAASIFFAIFFAIFMRSFQLGTYGYMIEQSIEAYSGYLQIQDPTYFDDPTINNSMAYTDSLKSIIEAHENISAIAPRIESFALASTGNQSKGVMVTGIDPVAEQKVSDPEHRLVQYKFTKKAIEKLKKEGQLPKSLIKKIEINAGKNYSNEARIQLDLDMDDEKAEKYLPAIKKQTRFESHYLTENDDGVLLSGRLSSYLKAEIGDTIILMGQGYHGVSAAGLYPVRGIVTMTSPDLDNKLIFMTLSHAKQFLGLQNQITSLAINLNDKSEMKDTQKALSAMLDDSKYTVKNWEELNPILKQQIEGDNVGGKVFLFILYVIVFFGIFGTVVMMIAERRREFGVMVAIGMKRKKISTMVSLEMFFIGLLGTLAGMIASAPLLLYGHYNPLRLTGDMGKMYEDMGFDPIMPLALFDSYFFMQGLVILIMIILACIGPIRQIRRLNAIKAIHG
jgi:ABC-type lipoprotein release transport system permease subunit